jgi:uncharacterized short protein YbdD (DUF466 family)
VKRPDGPLARGIAAFACRAVPAWNALRTATGDDAYERYLAHCARRHPGVAVVSREAFYTAELERRWSGVNRCC